MNLNSPKTKIAMLVAALCAPLAANATNGMNLQGYGPIAGAMGGASMAYDNGLAATMNNPATLGLMTGSRLDVALGALIPTVEASASGAPTAKSTGGPYMMPAVGYATHNGNLTYGFGVFAQGGMGTDYDANSFLALGSGEPVRSELGVGRLIFPFAYNVDSNFTVGGSIDYVWATLDLRMALPASTFGSLVTNCSGGGCAPLTGYIAANPNNWTRIDFSDSNDFSGAAKGSGYAFKLGFVYKADPTLSVGASFHAKTSLSDLKSSDSATTISAQGSGTLGTGKILIRDFQWPETWAVGFAWTPTDKTMVVADVKYIGWKAVMKDFKMTFEGSLAGSATVVDAALPQYWDNQSVFQAGFAHKMTDAFTLRAGLNYTFNPIPAAYVNPLFPAIFQDHYDIGFGYALGKDSSIDGSLVYATSVDATNGQGVTSKVGGYEVQIMYSQRF